MSLHRLRFFLPGDLQLGLKDVERARRLAVRTSVHQNGGLVTLIEGIGEVEPADAEIGDAHAVRQVASRQATHDFDAKGVIAEEDIADAGDQYLWFLES